MNLKPQDVVIALKLLESRTSRPTYAQLASDLFMSQSEVHASIRRARASKLLHSEQLGDRPNISNLKEFLVHGLRYVFPAETGAMTRGLPTAWAAEPLNRKLTQEEPVPVWPYEQGTKRGFAFFPLHKKVPQAALKDPKLYQLLSLVDALREGRARDRAVAKLELFNRLRASA